jgi:hypothetical protein
MELPVKNLVLTLAIASALLIAACGKKDEQAPAAPATQNPAPTATPPTTTPPPAEGTQPNDPAAQPAEPPADQPNP